MTDADLISAYASGPALIRRATAGMSRDQLLAAPVPGKWSTQQVVIHLADADLAFAHRLKRIIAEDQPAYAAWSENDFARVLQYDEQLAEDAIAQIEVVHRQLHRVMLKLAPGWLDRTGTHKERGVQTARQVLEYAVWHISHHLKFVEDKKAKLGLT
jgi:uncharacterized damage-inducible protein DinB